MALIDDMTNGIKEHQEAFALLNNNEDASKKDVYNAVIMQAYRNLRDLLKRYEQGER